MKNQAIKQLTALALALILAISVVPASFFVDASTSNARVFVPAFGEVYYQGEIIYYNGRLYEVLQTFTFYGDPNWHPGIAPSLWRFVGTGTTPTPPPPPSGDARDFVSQFGAQYHIGEIIRYNGRLYEVLQSFTFYGDPNWHPGIAPSLWRFVGMAGTPVPTPTPTPTPEPTPAPTPPPVREPYIRVTTEFPTGTVTRSFVDISYEFFAGYGEDVQMITFLTSGQFYGTIYYRGNDHTPTLGTLGTARVFLFPGHNEHIVFTMINTAGQVVTYTVVLDVTLDEGFNSPPPDEREIAWSIDDPNRWFVRDRILLGARMGVTFEQVEQSITIFDGEIIGWCAITDLYTVQVQSTSETQLRIIILTLTEITFPELFDFGSLWYIENTNQDYDEFYFYQEIFSFMEQMAGIEEWRGCTCYLLHGNCGCVNNCTCGFYANTNPAQNRTRDGWWQPSSAHNTPREWGLSAINIPYTWSTFGNNMRNNISVGIVDSGIINNHQDLLIPIRNLGSYLVVPYPPRGHGTHIMSTIGSIHNNFDNFLDDWGRQLTGVINICRYNLFSFDTFNVNYGRSSSDSAVLAGLRWNVVRGVRVINVSLQAGGRYGVGPLPQSFNNNLYIRQMERLLALGYDFVVIHAAGNERVDASRSGVFSNIIEGHPLRNRIITVGATAQVGDSFVIADFGFGRDVFLTEAASGIGQTVYNVWLQGSNFGSIVDVVAPGYDIFGAFSPSTNSFVSAPGTSAAAPHVAGVAALVWSENPGLTGEQVKEIIVESARIGGYRIFDTRRREVERPWNPDGVGDLINRIPPRPVIPYMAVYYQVDAMAALQMARGITPVHVNNAHIIGRIVNYDTGEPVLGVNIYLYCVATNSRVTSTAISLLHFCSCPVYNRNCELWHNRGHFRFDNVALGGYRLVVSGPQFQTREYQLYIAEAGVETVHIRVIPAGGVFTRPLNNVPIRWIDGVAHVWIRAAAEAYGFDDIGWNTPTRTATIYGMANGVINLNIVGGYLDLTTGHAYIPRLFALTFFEPYN